MKKYVFFAPLSQLQPVNPIQTIRIQQTPKSRPDQANPTKQTWSIKPNPRKFYSANLTRADLTLKNLPSKLYQANLSEETEPWKLTKQVGSGKPKTGLCTPNPPDSGNPIQQTRPKNSYKPNITQQTMTQQTLPTKLNRAIQIYAKPTQQTPPSKPHHANTSKYTHQKHLPRPSKPDLQNWTQQTLQN